MKKNKGKIIKEVKFSPEEWEHILKLSKKYKKLPAPYIREKAVDGQILQSNLYELLYEFDDTDNKTFYDINKIAKTVNTEKLVYESDVIEIEKVISAFEDFVHNKLKPFTFREVTFSWQ